MDKFKKISALFLQYAFVVFMCLLIVVPILILIIASFKGNMEFAKSSIWTLPESLNFANYLSVLQKGKFGLAFFNTFIILTCSVVINVILGSMLAYVLGRFKFLGKTLILFLIMGARIIPTITTQVAVFTTIKGLGLYDSLFAPIILYAGTDVVQIFLYLQFVNSIPYSLDESARLDGASYFQIYRMIIFPLLKPVTITVAILKMVTIYNDMYIPYLYLPSTEHGVVSTALMKFCGSAYGSQIPLLAAAFVIVMIPMLLLYIFAQRFIFDGMTSGAVKG